jgi:hypothetical protein
MFTYFLCSLNLIVCKLELVELRVFTDASMKMAVLWDVAMHSLVGVSEVLAASIIKASHITEDKLQISSVTLMTQT